MGMFALTGPKGFNEQAARGETVLPLQLSEICIYDRTGKNVALFGEAKQAHTDVFSAAEALNSPIMSWQASDENPHLNPYSDHEYIPRVMFPQQRENKVAPEKVKQWLQDGKSSNFNDVVEWKAPMNVNPDRITVDDGVAVEGEVIAMFKFPDNYPVEVKNVTLFTTPQSYPWNGSVLLALSDGLWRPLIKNLTVVVVRNNNTPFELSVRLR